MLTLAKIEYFDILRPELQQNDQKWAKCIENMKDPYQLREEKMQAEKAQKEKEEEALKQSSARG